MNSSCISHRELLSHFQAVTLHVYDMAAAGSIEGAKRSASNRVTRFSWNDPQNLQFQWEKIEEDDQQFFSGTPCWTQVLKDFPNDSWRFLVRNIDQLIENMDLATVRALKLYLYQPGCTQQASVRSRKITRDRLWGLQHITTIVLLQSFDATTSYY